MAQAQRIIRNDLVSVVAEQNHEALMGVPEPKIISRELHRAAARPKPVASPQDVTEKAYRALHIGFVALPIVAGIDKFANVLTDWSQYLAPIIPSSLGVSPGAFMVGVGVVEICIGIGMVMKPRFFADLLGLWLMAIVANLLLQGEAFDVALFDFALAAGACGLARLSQARKLASKIARSRPPRPAQRTLHRVS